MFVAHAYVMAEDEDENIIKKAEQDKRQIDTGKENPPFTTPAENPDQTEKNTQDTIPANEQKSSDSLSDRNYVERDPVVVDADQNVGKMQKRFAGSSIPGLLARKPLIVVLIVGAIILGGFLIYAQVQLSNQSYKVENYNALWNQSLANLRGGNTSLADYCNNLVHDDELCKRFMNLQYMG